MPLANLGQEIYKDGNGHDIVATEIDVLTPYRHISDGFYIWACGACGHAHNDRSCGWAISAQVLPCASCHKMNLLVRTNCIQIDEALSGKWRSAEMEQENARLTGIERFNEEQIQQIRREVVAEVTNALERAAHKVPRKPLPPARPEPPPLLRSFQIQIAPSGVGPIIECLLCGSRSFNQNDIATRYCGRCYLFHDEVQAARTRQTADLSTTHNCGDWRTAINHCAVCDAVILGGKP